MTEITEDKIRSLIDRLESGDASIPPNLMRAMKYDWFGNLHPKVAQARIKQIPHSWYDRSKLSDEEDKIFGLYLDGKDAEAIAGSLKKSQEKVENHLGKARSKLWGALEPKKGGWQNFLLLAGRGFGKMLKTDLPLPTPNGWTTMGEVEVGDELLDEKGKPTKILSKTPVQIPKKAFELEFSDGTTIEACSEHQWVTWTHYERKAFLRSQYVDDHSNFPDNWSQWRSKRKFGTGEPKVYPQYTKGPRVRTTQEIVDTLTFGKRNDNNHAIPMTKPLDLPRKDLPVSPYTLGAWLGDGSKKDTTLSIMDKEILQRVEKDGYKTKEYKTPKDKCNQYKLGKHGSEPDSLHQNLKKQNLIRNKHIPPKYLRASPQQRLELLRGLMDTDGWVESQNYVAITQKRRKLLDDIEELVISLGMKTNRRTRTYANNGGIEDNYHEISFRATEQVFNLPRKADRLDLSVSQGLRNKHRMIVGAKRIDTSPMQCITVDSPNSMYLAGESMIPTHNTRAGAEIIKEYVRRGWAKRIALVAPTPGKARDDLLRKVHSGLLQIYPEDEEPKYKPTKKRLEWDNGAEANIYSGANPDEIRGPEFDLAWCDELAAYKYPRDTWDNLQFALRLGDHPQTIISTTPKPIPTLIDIVEDENTIISKGSTYENEDNLPESFYNHVVKKYEGTTLGQQEIYADILSDSKKALWNRDIINNFRLDGGDPQDIVERCERVVVAIDPAVGDKEENDETGIIAAGSNGDIGWVLEDGSMGGARPQKWANKAVNLYKKYEADRIVAETNQGGDMVEQTLRTVDSTIPYKGVKAKKGKRTRAEPVAALYEQGRIHHVGVLGTLEDQLVTWEPGRAKSPDRLDALVYALSELMLQNRDRRQGWELMV